MFKFKLTEKRWGMKKHVAMGGLARWRAECWQAPSGHPLSWGLESLFTVKWGPPPQHASLTTVLSGAPLGDEAPSFLCFHQAGPLGEVGLA